MSWLCRANCCVTPPPQPQPWRTSGGTTALAPVSRLILVPGPDCRSRLSNAASVRLIAFARFATVASAILMLIYTVSVFAQWIPHNLYGKIYHRLCDYSFVDYCCHFNIGRHWSLLSHYQIFIAAKCNITFIHLYYESDICSYYVYIDPCAYKSFFFLNPRLNYNWSKNIL